jgi:uncharacterized membrane protein
MSSFNQDDIEFADADDIASNKFMAICAYLGILVLIPLILGKQSTFASFHARQGVNVFLIYVLSSIVSYIPFLPFDGMISGIAYIAAIVFSIIGILNVARGSMKRLPVIGDLRLL